jgi:hypothetical protein
LDNSNIEDVSGAFLGAVLEHQDCHGKKPFHLVIVSVCADGSYYATDTGSSGLSNDLISNCLEDLSDSIRTPVNG